MPIDQHSHFEITGSDDERADIRAWRMRHRERILHVFEEGKSFPTIHELIHADPLDDSLSEEQRMLRSAFRSRIDTDQLEEGVQNITKCFEQMCRERGIHLPTEIAAASFLNSIHVRLAVAPSRHPGTAGYHGAVIRNIGIPGRDAEGNHTETRRNYSRTVRDTFRSLATGVAVIENPREFADLHLSSELGALVLLRELTHDYIAGHSRSAMELRTRSDFTLHGSIVGRVGFSSANHDEFFAMLEPTTERVTLKLIRAEAQRQRERILPTLETPLSRLVWAELSDPEFVSDFVSWLDNGTASHAGRSFDEAHSALDQADARAATAQAAFLAGMRSNYVGVLGDYVRYRHHLGIKAGSEPEYAFETALLHALYHGPSARTEYREQARNALGLENDEALESKLAYFKECVKTGRELKKAMHSSKGSADG